MEVNFGKFFAPTGSTGHTRTHTVILYQSSWGKVASFLDYGMVANKHTVKRTMPTSKETQVFLMLSHSSTLTSCGELLIGGGGHSNVTTLG